MRPTRRRRSSARARRRRSSSRSSRAASRPHPRHVAGVAGGPEPSARDQHVQRGAGRAGAGAAQRERAVLPGVAGVGAGAVEGEPAVGGQRERREARPADHVLDRALAGADALRHDADDAIAGDALVGRHHPDRGWAGAGEVREIEIERALTGGDDLAAAHHDPRRMSVGDDQIVGAGQHADLVAVGEERLLRTAEVELHAGGRVERAVELAGLARRGQADRDRVGWRARLEPRQPPRHAGEAGAADDVAVEAAAHREVGAAVAVEDELLPGAGAVLRGDVRVGARGLEPER